MCSLKDLSIYFNDSHNHTCTLCWARPTVKGK